MASKPLIITSVPPRTSRIVGGDDIGNAYIAACLTSWRDAGFDIISVNPAAEIAQSAERNLPVNFVPTDTPGVPLIAELLAVARDQGARLTGIVNADCHMLPAANLLTGLLRHTEGRMVLCERIDRDNGTLAPLEETSGGFDGFFFDAAALGQAPEPASDPGFRLGDVWWDYWFPCLGMAMGLEVRRIIHPLLGHLSHPPKWDPETYALNGVRMAATLDTLAQVPGSHPALRRAAPILQTIAQLDPAAFAYVMRDWLRHSGDWPETPLNAYPDSLAEDYLALLRNAPRRVAPRLPTIDLGQRVLVSAGEPGTAHRLGGWSFPEPWGCWIDGARGDLALRLAERPRHDLRLSISLRAHVSAAAPLQAVTLAVNAVPLACPVLDNDGRHDIEIIVPHAVIGPEGQVDLSIWASAPHSPFSVYGSGDTRTLSAGVFDLCLVAA